MDDTKEQLTIMVIDDEDGIRRTIGSILEDEGFTVILHESAEAALPDLVAKKPDIVFLDIWLPGKDGLKFFKDEHGHFSSVVTIMISGHGTIDMAVQALKLGAFDFIEKPLSLDKLMAVLHGAKELSWLKRENTQLRARLRDEDAMVGTSQATEELRTLIRQAANTPVPVFIQGENGTGKELVARTIHRNSKRHQKPFIAVNCAAIPETLIESELFGHEKGAFTGAINQKKGRFELAHQGTLFLDEVLDLSASAQAKLLRVLQEMEFERVGGKKSVKVDVRIIAASNKNVHLEVREGRFREDLFYRLHVLPIHVSPLRERRDDIPSLCAYFLNLEADAQARPVPELSKEALDLIGTYDWPGNVRQLRNILQRLLVICDDFIDESSTRKALGLDEPRKVHQGSLEANQDNKTLESLDAFWDRIMALDLQNAKDTFEERFLLQQLLHHGYNVTHTAQALGMYPSNLHAKIRKYGFER